MVLQRDHRHRIKLLTLWIAAWGAGAVAQSRPIDTRNSVLTVHVSKAGVLSALGHDHEVSAPIERGTVNLTTRQVQLYANAAALRVRDPEVSNKDRAEIQSTMTGPEVLDAAREPTIAFRSTSVEPVSAGAWRVTGDLTLHGQTHPVTVDVRENAGHYVGTSHFRQSEFGIKPIKLAGGAVRVKDEIRVAFDIQLAR